VSHSKRTGHYVVSSHWDREWYESFQDYRFRLVNMLDELLDRMERDAEFAYYQSDGQSILWEDYLEIRPERENQIRVLARQGRLRIGPWYVLPDEFIVSGESLVRNLQMGLKTASKFGTPCRAGFVCDLFGHTSQMPQILRGFGIDNAFLFRGTNESTHGVLFNWQSPDGSEVITYRFSPVTGYVDFAENVRLWMEPDKPFEIEQALKDLGNLLDNETKRCPTPSFLVFDGGDHMEPEPQITELIRRANEKFQDVELIHSHLEGFVEDLREQREQITKTFVGELREPGEVGDANWVIAGVLSSRIHLKQANARCENELSHWSEPFSSFANRLGYAYPTSFIETAWRYLLQNHPHDSICTCSIDQVHKDMAYRFDQCQSIASHVTRDALQHIADGIVLPEMTDKDTALIVFNPSADAIDGPVDLTLRFPNEIDTIYQEFFGYEPKIGFRLFDVDDRELPYQYVNQRRDQIKIRRRMRKLIVGEKLHEVDVTVPLCIPPYGYTRILCRPEAKPTRHLGSMLINDHTVENEYLQVSAAANGTLTLTDKTTGHTYKRLLTLEDRADIGDGWHHGVAVNDEIYTSNACSAEVAVIADGFARVTLKIRIKLDVPAEFQFSSMTRSAQHKSLIVTHHVTLRQASQNVEVRTEVENTIRDHRLRVLMPSGTDTDTYLADQAFDVVERPIALRADNARYKEIEVETKPQQTWTAVFDENRGLAVVATGLPESAVRDLPERPIALTLFRSFIKATQTTGQEGGEIQGRHEFRYLIVPLSGQPDVARLCRLGQQLAAGTRVVQIDLSDCKWQEANGYATRDLPASQSFLEIGSSDAVVTAIHKNSEPYATTIRMFNPTQAEIEVPIAVNNQVESARLMNLESKPGKKLKLTDGKISVRLKAKQIVTVEIQEKKTDTEV